MKNNKGFIELKSVQDYWKKLSHEYEELKNDYENVYNAFNFIVTAYHLVDWVYEGNKPGGNELDSIPVALSSRYICQPANTRQPSKCRNIIRWLSVATERSESRDVSKPPVKY